MGPITISVSLYVAIISKIIDAINIPKREKKSFKGSTTEFIKFNLPSSVFFSSLENITPTKPRHINPAINLNVIDQPFISAKIKANDVAAIIASR